MPPAKKKTKTTTTEKVPAAAAAAGRSLTDLNDETLERVASFLSPPSVYNLARASKKTFWAERDDGAPPLGTTLAQAALRRQLARVGHVDIAKRRVWSSILHRLVHGRLTAHEEPEQAHEDDDGGRTADDDRNDRAGIEAVVCAVCAQTPNLPHKLLGGRDGIEGDDVIRDGRVLQLGRLHAAEHGAGQGGHADTLDRRGHG